MATKGKNKTSKKNSSLFSKNILTRRLLLPFNKVSENIKDNLEILLKKKIRRIVL